jgi:hypothetical protein
MARKYYPLEHYLHGISVKQWDITVTVAQIEQILKNKLLPSAYQHRAWWANERHGRHVNDHARLDASGKVADVDQQRGLVRFRRV